MGPTQVGAERISPLKSLFPIDLWVSQSFPPTVIIRTVRLSEWVCFSSKLIALGVLYAESGIGQSLLAPQVRRADMPQEVAERMLVMPTQSISLAA